MFVKSNTFRLGSGCLKMVDGKTIQNLNEPSYKFFRINDDDSEKHERLLDVWKKFLL